MSENNVLARPYAKAAFELALEQNALSKWSTMLATLTQIAADENTIVFLGNPRVTTEQQVSLFCDVCGSVLDDTGKQFVRVLADNERLRVLPEISVLYEALRAEQEKTLDVMVTSAMPIDEARQQKLTAALKARFKRDVTLQCDVDEALIAGAVIRAGDTVLSNTISTRIVELRESLVR